MHVEALIRHSLKAIGSTIKLKERPADLDIVRRDSTGKKAGDVGYVSALKQRQLDKKAAEKTSKPKTQAQKDVDAKSAINSWVSATNATKGKKGIARHKAIKAQSEASKKATKAIREKTGRGFFKEGGLMTKGKKKK